MLLQCMFLWQCNIRVFVLTESQQIFFQFFLYIYFKIMSSILVSNQYSLYLVFVVNQSCVGGQSWQYKVGQETRYHGLQFRFQGTDYLSGRILHSYCKKVCVLFLLIFLRLLLFYCPMNNRQTNESCQKHIQKMPQTALALFAIFPWSVNST